MPPALPGYLSRQLGMKWRQRFTGTVSGKIGPAYVQADYQQASITDDDYHVSADTPDPV